MQHDNDPPHDEEAHDSVGKSTHKSADEGLDEGFIELAPSTLEAIKAAGKRLDDDVKAGRIDSGSSRWVMAPSGERFCIRHPGPKPEPDPDSETHRQSALYRWWNRLLARVKR